MFKQARLKREQLNERLNNFFKFKQGNATVTSALNSSVQKRKKIEEHLNRWSNPYAQTGFEPHQDMSMSFRFSESNFHQNKDEQTVRRDLEKEFYEGEERESTPKKVLKTEQLMEEAPLMSPVLERIGPVKQVKTSPKKEDPSPIVELKTSPKKQSPLPQDQSPQKTQSMDKPAQIMIPDSLQTERVETPRLPQPPVANPPTPKVADRSLSIGDSVFNILNDHSMPPVADQSSIPIIEQPEEMMAQTIKPQHPRHQEQVLSISRAEELHDSPIPAQKQKLPVTNQLPQSKSSVKNESSGLGNNSSQGIFFTDDFREFLSKKHSDQKDHIEVPTIVVSQPLAKIEEKQPSPSLSPRKQIQEIVQITPAVHSTPRQREPEQKPQEHDNHLGDSLTLSIVDRVFNQKIIHHLVLSADDFALNTFEKETSQKRITEMAQKYHHLVEQHEIRQKTKAVKQLQRFFTLSRRIKQGTLYQYFLHFKLFRQYKFNKVKRNIMIQKYRTNKTTKHLQKMFKFWKDLTKAHKRWIDTFRQQSDHNKLFIGFKHWKMYWFGKKIKKQAVTFRIATLFQAWRKTAAEQKIRDNRKAMKFFYKSSLRKGFSLLLEGVENSQREKHNAHQAESFNYLRLARKYFDAWREIAQEIIDIKLERDYIPIQMTVRNKLSSGISSGTSGSSSIPSLLQTREISVNIPK